VFTCRIRLTGLALTVVMTAAALAAGPVDASGSAASPPTAAIPTYGVTSLPLTGSNNVISPNGAYVAGYGSSGITELHLSSGRIQSRLLSLGGGYNPTITSVSDDGLVAGCAACGVSGESYPFASPFVTGPGQSTALAPPCLFYADPTTFANAPMEDCGVKWHGTATSGYLQYRAESAFVNAAGTVEGNSNCPPPQAAGACGPPTVYSAPPGYCAICSSNYGGLYSWSGGAKSALTPFGLSAGHAVLGAVMDAEATNGDYAGTVQCSITYPPQAPSAFPCPSIGTGAGTTYFVGGTGGDYAISPKRFTSANQLAVNGINSSDTVVGSLQPGGYSSTPVPWEAQGAGGWKQLPYPSTIAVSNGRRSQTEPVTGGAALAINDEGFVVGYVTTANFGSDQAVMWTPAGKFVLLNSQLNAYDQYVAVLKEAVGITAGGEILVQGSVRGSNDDALLLGPATCSHISLKAPLRYRTGQTVVDYRVTGVTSGCGPAYLTVDGHVVERLPDHPSIQSGQAVVDRRLCNPTVAALQGDRAFEDGGPAGRRKRADRQGRNRARGRDSAARRRPLHR